MPYPIKELTLTTIAAAALVYLFPQYLTVPRFSRTVVRFLLVDFGLYWTWITFIYPFFFSPLRNLPGPTVCSTGRYRTVSDQLSIRLILQPKLIWSRAAELQFRKWQWLCPILKTNWNGVL